MIVGVEAQDKVYDTTTVATLTGGTLSGILGSDTVTVTAGTGLFPPRTSGLEFRCSPRGMVFPERMPGTTASPPNRVDFRRTLAPAAYDHRSDRARQGL